MEQTDFFSKSLEKLLCVSVSCYVRYTFFQLTNRLMWIRFEAYSHQAGIGICPELNVPCLTLEAVSNTLRKREKIGLDFIHIQVNTTWK